MSRNRRRKVVAVNTPHVAPAQERTNYCLFWGTNVDRIVAGWRPEKLCDGTPGGSEDHVHIARETHDALFTQGRVIVIDEQRRIIALKPEQKVSPGDEARASVTS